MDNKEPLFYLRDTRTNIGTNVTFWRKEGAGYGTNLDELEVFTLDRAQKFHNSRKTDVPLLKSAVDELSVWAVDHQYLRDPVAKFDDGEQYVVVVKGEWNGNDAQFVTRNESFTYNYRFAGVFSADEASAFCASGNKVAYPRALTDGLARRTFQVENIDTRKMITGAGIKLTKPKRKRKTSGKVRANCPRCGVFVWSYDPHVADYCRDCHLFAG